MHDGMPAQRAVWIICVAQDRCLKTEAGEVTQKIRGRLKQSLILGEIQLTIPGRNGKPAHPVRQAPHAAIVT